MSKQQPVVAIVSPGDMGHVVGQALISHGLRVIAALAGRSARTRSLAAKAAIMDVGSYAALVCEADMILSILAPAEALATSRSVAASLREANRSVLYVDCNAIAPATVAQIDAIITAAGSRFADAAIIGPPPRQPGATRFYASGRHAAEFAQLRAFGLDIPLLGSEAGQASALKMCYAALTKGFTALCTELLTAAAGLQVYEPLVAELQQSQSGFYEQMRKGLPTMPPKARRWVGEMEEIAATFAQAGLTPQILAGAAEIYRLVGATPLADRTPEDPTPPPTLAEMITVLATARPPAASDKPAEQAS